MSRTSAKRSADKLFDSPEQEAYLQLWRTYDRLREIEEQLFGQHHLTAQQYNALRVLQSLKGDPMPTSSLGSRLVSRAPDMTRMLDKLEERKLVARQRNRVNRRVVEVSITSAGTALLKKLAADVRGCSREQLGHMSPTALRQMVKLLKEARLPHEAKHVEDTWPGNE
ncbi:MAG: MarR family winged helix-turn-helix transcriptional regulator [Planctomycetota bacterium]|jgi:DNA-binding MarR family transcriptional regulator